jgi:hypothetical protein
LAGAASGASSVDRRRAWVCLAKTHHVEDVSGAVTSRWRGLSLRSWLHLPQEDVVAGDSAARSPGGRLRQGTARIWRIVSGQKPALYGSGFTNISDLAFDAKNLLVLEIADKGLYDPNSTRARIPIAPDGTRTALASSGLVNPTGLAVGRDSIYISSYGIFPGAGPGPHGDVARTET